MSRQALTARYMLAAAERYQTGDLAIVTNCYYFEHRVRSFELVGQIFGAETPVQPVEAETLGSDD